MRLQLADAEKWMKEFYEKRGWTEYGPFIRVGFLMEEAGELARAVRAYEIGRDRPDEKESSRAEQKQELIEKWEMSSEISPFLLICMVSL